MEKLKYGEMNPLDVYLRRKPTIFSESVDPEIAFHFEELIKNSDNFEIEIARKLRIEKRTVYNRVNLLFKYNLLKNYIGVLTFLKRISDIKKVNLAHSEKFLKKIKFNKLVLVATGLDPAGDKISFWLEFINEPKLLFDAIKLHGYNSEMINLMPDTYSFLVGFDYFLNGKTDTTSYYAYRNPDYENPIVKLKLSQYIPLKVLKVMQGSPLTYLSFRKPHFKKYVQIFSNDVCGILDKLNVKEEFIKLNMGLEGLDPYIVGFFVDEVVSGRITDDLNLYYRIYPNLRPPKSVM